MVIAKFAEGLKMPIELFKKDVSQGKLIRSLEHRAFQLINNLPLAGRWRH